VSGLLLTFTNLFPSSLLPTHGVFVAERMRRVAGLDPERRWQVVAPVPRVAWFVRGGVYRRWAAVPERESWQGTDVLHPRYRHWPGLSLRRQADEMADGAEAVVRALAAGQATVLDAHYLWPDGVAAAELAARLHLPYVLTARGSDLNVVANDAGVRRRIVAAAASAFACFAVSAALCERFASVAGLPRERIVEVRNGVDLERFRPGDRAAARRRLGLPAAGRVLLGVGRLVPGKGFDRAAAALARLPADVRLVLVGDGPARRAIAAAGGDRVRFLGTLPSDLVALAYCAADLLVLPSEREGWPNVVTEALAAGLRVVATAVGGIPEILGAGPAVDPRLGALVPRGDDDALVAALRDVLDTPADAAFVRRFAERYDWEEPVRLLDATFAAALKRGSA
jgi:teichuronic acid biosynthesis glycosyltransferase TuaC